MKSTPNKEHTKMSNATITRPEAIDISQLQLGDKVEVRVSRRYGEEQEHADSWTAYVQSVDAERDMIYVTHNSPETMTDPTPTCQGVERLGSNPDGIDPACSPSGVVLVKSDGRRYSIRNENRTAIEAAASKLQGYKVSKALVLASKVQSVSYKDRAKLASDLSAAIRELAI